MNKSSRRKHGSGRPRGNPQQGRQSRGHSHGEGQPSVQGLTLYGQHPVQAALANKDREIMHLWGTHKALQALRDQGALTDKPPFSVTASESSDIAALVGADVPHQGIVAEVKPLPGRHLESLEPVEGRNLLLVLDQVTDPHNVGAIMRSASAFGARAIITTDRNAPQESGALAKSASGALETLPWVRVTNLSRALDQLAEMGYWRVGLDGSADQDLKDTDAGQNVALVLGAEGKGLREGTAKHCDFLARLPISDAVESLNVSNAAAVALYELVR